MAAISACPIHRTPLISRCEFCGDRQVTYKKTRELGFCQNCGQSLADRRKPLKPMDFVSSWENFGFDLIRLFEDMPEAAIFPDDGIRESLKKIHDYYWERERESELYKVIPMNKLIMAIEGRQKLSFLLVRRISHSLGIPLATFLNGDAEYSDCLFDDERLCVLPPGFLDKRSKVKHDHEQTLNEILQFVTQSSVPPTIKCVAEAVGVSIGYIEYNHPKLVHLLVENRQNHVEGERRANFYAAQRFAIQFFFDEKYSDQPHSRRHAYRTLKAETGLPKAVLKQAIGAAALIFESSVKI